MGFLYFLEDIRIPVLNEFMLLITRMGEETAFLAVAMIIFWCVNKYKGYYVLGVGFLGTIISQFMKLWFRVPRPWIQDPNFSVMEAAKPAAEGYSFPSGHTQTAVGTYGAIAYVTKVRWVRIVAIIVAVLVPFSRMYLGVHTPADVLVAAGLSILLILVLKPLFFGNNHGNIPVLLSVMFLVGVAYLLFVEFYNFPVDMDPYNQTHGTENAYTLLGALMGLVVVYYVDEKWLNFQTDAVWWAQFIKVGAGLILVVCVKAGLKSPLNDLMGEYIGRLVRYFLVVIVAGILWPLTFKWFAKMGGNENGIDSSKETL